MRDMLKGEVERFFRPEFLNRVDDLIYFKPLNREDLKHIVDINLADVFSRLAKKNIKLVVDDATREFLLEKGYSVEFGARPLRRAIERYIEDPLSEELLRGRVAEGMTVEVKVGSENALVFETKAPEPKSPPPALTATTA
jgi:ATP-dependent Clp protease ATP-binding subunit ClpC